MAGLAFKLAELYAPARMEELMGRAPRLRSLLRQSAMSRIRRCGLCLRWPPTFAGVLMG